MRISGVLAMITCFAAANVVLAQTGADASLPDAPSRQIAADRSNPSTAPATSADTRTKFDASASAVHRLGWMCGGGVSQSSVGAKPTTGCGVGMTLVPVPVYIEAGVMGPQVNRSNVSGYVSADMSVALARHSPQYLPMAMIGYSRLFETGHTLDYGVAIVMPRWGKQKNGSDSMRLELRDYWTFANPVQHNVMLRLGWMDFETD